MDQRILHRLNGNVALNQHNLLQNTQQTKQITQHLADGAQELPIIPNSQQHCPNTFFSPGSSPPQQRPNDASLMRIAWQPKVNILSAVLDQQKPCEVSERRAGGRG